MKQRDIDNGYAKLVRSIFALGAPKIAFGVFEADGAQPAGNGVTVLDVATWQEFGTATIPERSFLRAWFDENQGRAVEALRRLLVSVVEGKRKPEQAMQLFAEWALGEIRQRMANGIPPANAPSTISKKGSSVPLIEDGQLRSTVTYGIDMGHGMKVHKTGARVTSPKEPAKPSGRRR